MFFCNEIILIKCMGRIHYCDGVMLLEWLVQDLVVIKETHR